MQLQRHRFLQLPPSAVSVAISQFGMIVGTVCLFYEMSASINTFDFYRTSLLNLTNTEVRDGLQTLSLSLIRNFFCFYSRVLISVFVLFMIFLISLPIF